MFLFVQKIHHIGNGPETGQFLVGDNNAVIVFNPHEELKDVKRVGSEIFLDIGIERDGLRVTPELFCKDCFYFFKHIVANYSS